MSSLRRRAVHVEAQIKEGCPYTHSEVRAALREYFESCISTVKNGGVDLDREPKHKLATMVQELQIDGAGLYAVSKSSADLNFHVFRLSKEEAVGEEIDEEDDLAAYKMWTLPSADFKGYWESLYFDEDIMHNLLDYSESAMNFSQKGVNSTLIAFNRIILLHGPPGTGKTTLCKALAQKLSIRLGQFFKYGHLIEINAHSLFSKWFSESGKLVSKLFSQIEEYVEDKSLLICILIDEVESLTAARSAAMAGNEPSDSIRVVNSVLTHLDALRTRPNVFVFTTSNLTNAIDEAFLDRADIRQYIGPPSMKGRYEILRSCMVELKRTGFLECDDDILPFEEATNSVTGVSQMLLNVTRETDGMSGRYLRKLPFVAFSLNRLVSRLGQEEASTNGVYCLALLWKNVTDHKAEDFKAYYNLLSKALETFLKPYEKTPKGLYLQRA